MIFLLFTAKMPLSSNHNATTFDGMDRGRRDEADSSINKNRSADNMTETERQMRDEELSFYTNSENEHGDDNIWGLLSGVGGNIYEW